MKKGWIGVDLDGTLAEHYWPQDGPFDELRIGKPIPKMIERVKTWIAKGIEVRIFTARVGPQDDADDLGPVYRAIWAWTLEHIGTALTATCMKDYRMLEMWDDRAIQIICNTGLRADGAA